MLKQFILFLLLGISSGINAQFKNDNVKYTTIDMADLCKALNANNGYLLLDVRTKGEFYDTSSSASYNLGRLNGAVNISVRELGSRIADISNYKDKPVFIYCSHSQRSRRAGKMLADSGFTKVFNVNGGITSIYYNSLYTSPCMRKMLESFNQYSLISAIDLCGRMIGSKAPFLLDVRPDSAFRHISRDAKENAYGAFINTVNIPLADLEKRLGEIPRDREIIITDIFGEEAAEAAVLLLKKGYINISVLIEGIDRLIQSDEKTISGKKILYKSPVAYKIFSTTEFARYYKKKDDILLLDIRSRSEFENKHADYWRNTGHLQNAVNIPADELEKSKEGLGTNKERAIVIYTFGNGPEVYAVADGLQKDGYTNISVLAGGIFNLRWTAGNVKGHAWLKDLVVDIPESNQ
jgi:rhodanese-related sulfurtransferase